MQVERLKNGHHYAIFEFDRGTDLHEGDVAMKALENLKPRYRGHPNQRVITQLLSSEIHNEGTVQYRKKTHGLAIPLYPNHAAVLGKALHLYAGTLRDINVDGVSTEIREARVLEVSTAESMISVLDQEFPIRPMEATQTTVVLK